jgi:hypothetical protein
MKTNFTKRTIILGVLFFLYLCISGPVVHATMNWKSVASPTYGLVGPCNEWAHVAWGATAPNGLGGMGLFVTVAGTGGVITSRDGISWIVSTTAPINEWTSIAWSPSLGLFVAVAASGVGNSVMSSPDGINWTTHAAINNWWLAVVWSPELSIFVAVAYAGGPYQVMTSPDGINWTGRYASAPNSWNAVTWAASAPNGTGGNGLFVAVAQSGIGDRIMTSPDGINWTSRLSTDDNFWNDVTWSPNAPNGLGGHGLFVAVNADATLYRIMTSPDGVNWRHNLIPVPLNNWYAVTWADSLPNGLGGYGLFLSVGYSNGTGDEIMTSPDGINWTVINNPADANWAQNYVGLVWSPELHLFVSFDYSTNAMMTSPDGIHWTDHPLPPCPVNKDSEWQSVTWGAGAPNGIGDTGLFVAVSLAGAVTDQVMTSRDGAVWTARTAASGNQWTSVAWSPALGLFAAVAQSGSGNRVMTSHDGITWTSRTSATNNDWQSVTWSPDLGIFVAVAKTGVGNRVMTSPNGITWTSRTTPADINYQSVTWSSSLGLFVAVASSGSGNRVMTSSDGINWTSRTSAADNHWQSVTWGAGAPNGLGGTGLFVAVGQTGTGNRIMTSPNGITWTSRTSPANYGWMSVAWSPAMEIFCAIADTGGLFANPQKGNFVMISHDGVNWTPGLDAISNFWQSVDWSPKLGMFAAVANSSVNILSSSNVGDFIMTSGLGAPSITNINAIGDTNFATITWTTDEKASSQVNFGLTSSYGSATVIDTTQVFYHSVVVTGLLCHNPYHFQVSSTTGGFNTLSGDHTFTTTGTSCGPAPIAGNMPVCMGTNMTLTDATTGGRWSSASPAVATIGSVTGIVTGIAAGNSVITYTVAGGSYTTTIVTVSPSPATSNTGTPTACVGSTTTLANGIPGGVWASSNTAIATVGTTTGSVTGMSVGTARITYSLTCGTAITQVTVHATPSVSSGPGVEICTGSSTVLSASGASVYSWSPATGLSATTGSSITATPITTTTYTITGTAAFGCSNTAMVTVSVNAIPTISASPNTAICNGAATGLTASGGATYLWAPAISVSAATGASITATPATTTTYTVTGTDARGCNNIAHVTVTVNAIPTISASPNTAICNGAATGLTASGGATYLWAPAISVSATTGASITATPATTTTYTITGTDIHGCNNIAHVTVTVNAIPTISASPNTTICNGATTGLTASGGATYLWGPATGLSATTGASITASPAATTAYTVTGTDAQGCNNVAHVTVTVNAIPTIIASPNTAICNGATTGLTASGGATYLWVPATGLSATTGASITASPAATIAYTVTGTDTHGCSNIAYVTVTVNAIPTISVTPGTTICNGASASLTASGGVTYSWGPATGLSSTTGASLTASPTATATYTVTGTSALGCSNTALVTVTVNPTPSIGAGAGTGICSGSSTGITATGASTFTWAPTTGLSATTGASVTASPASTTIYTITGTSLGCSGTTSVTVTVNSTPVISVGSVAAICSGLSTGLTATGGSTYTWSPATGLSATTGSTVIATPASTITYTVTGSISGCSNTATVAVTVNATPIITATDNGGPICAGKTLTLTSVANGGTGILHYTWIGPNTFNSSIQNPSITEATIDASGVYSVSVTDDNNCAAAGTHATIGTVNPAPVPRAISGSDAVCVSGTTTLIDSTNGGIWSISSGAATIGGGTGLLTGISIGGAIVSYSITNSYSCTGIVTRLIKVAGVPGNIYTFAGTGTPGNTGDGGPALQATMQKPGALATDNNGNLYICDASQNVVRKVDASGIITTVAGNGTAGNTGDGGQATAATLNSPKGIYMDNAGNLFISNTGSHTIRKVNSSGIISTIAGTAGAQGSTGDGGPAAAAKVNAPMGLCVDAEGNIYIADQGNNKVRKIDRSTSAITTIAGNGSAINSGDGGLAVEAKVITPGCVAVDNSGNLYITDALNSVRKVVLSTGIISTVAGTDIAGYTGDGEQATAAKLNTITQMAFDGSSMLYIADQQNQRIRQINLLTGIITSVAGTGTSGFSGEGGPAITANISSPAGVACDEIGNVYFSDLNNKIRVMSSKGGIKISLAGPSFVKAGTPVTFTASAYFTGSVSYQWQKNGVNVGNGGITYTNPNAMNGDVYKCILIVTPLCGDVYNDTSNSVTISTDVILNGQSAVALFPNPASETITVAGINFNNDEVVIGMYNQVGQLMLSRTVTVKNNEFKEQINMQSFATGTYVISVKDATNTATRLKCVKK